MLIFFDKLPVIVEGRRDRGDLVAYFTESLSGDYAMHLQVCDATSSELRQIADKLDELNGVKVSDPPFVMSMYANRQDLLEHKAAYYEKMYEKLRRMSPAEFTRLTERKVLENKDFDELLAAWPETI